MARRLLLWGTHMDTDALRRRRTDIKRIVPGLAITWYVYVAAGVCRRQKLENFPQLPRAVDAVGCPARSPSKPSLVLAG